jgi:hypothetical protein
MPVGEDPHRPFGTERAIVEMVMTGTPSNFPSFLLHQKILGIRFPITVK